jgi:hypothetical protein
MVYYDVQLVDISGQLWDTKSLEKNNYYVCSRRHDDYGELKQYFGALTTKVIGSGISLASDMNLKHLFQKNEMPRELNEVELIADSKALFRLRDNEGNSLVGVFDSRKRTYYILMKGYYVENELKWKQMFNKHMDYLENLYSWRFTFSSLYLDVPKED